MTLGELGFFFLYYFLGALIYEPPRCDGKTSSKGINFEQRGQGNTPVLALVPKILHSWVYWSRAPAVTIHTSIRVIGRSRSAVRESEQSREDLSPITRGPRTVYVERRKVLLARIR